MSRIFALCSVYPVSNKCLALSVHQSGTQDNWTSSNTLEYVLIQLLSHLLHAVVNQINTISE